MMRPQPDCCSGRAPGAASRPRQTRLLLLSALLAGLGWVFGCATAPPLTVADPAGQVSTLEGANQDSVLTGGRSYLTLGRSDGSDALRLAGSIAESAQNWETAMNLYESLPVDYPERSSSLLRARLQWRSSNLPPYAQQVFSSPRLTRSQLAILLVSLAPQLEAFVRGASPVLSDVDDLPCLREVLTAVRLDLFDIDRLEHRFFPTRAARLEEVRRAVEGLCHILEIEPPVWCEGAEAPAGCTLVSEPVRGEQVAEVVSRLTEAGEAMNERMLGLR